VEAFLNADDGVQPSLESGADIATARTSRVSLKIPQAKSLARFSRHRALDNLASWADPAFGGNHGIAESVNLAVDFCWIRDGASDLLT